MPARRLRRIGLDADEILFIDDSAANIAAAKALGFRTHHFVDPAGLGPALEAMGLLWSLAQPAGFRQPGS